MCHAGWPRLCEKSNLLNGIDDQLDAVTTALSTESGAMLKHGLTKEAPVNIRSTCHPAWTDNHNAPGWPLCSFSVLTRVRGSLADVAQFGSLFWPTLQRTGTLIRA